MEDQGQRFEGVEEVLDRATDNVTLPATDAGVRLPLERYTAAVCRQLLGREASAKEIDAWTTQLLSGVARQTFAICLLNSVESRLVRVRELYRQLLKTEATAADELFWLQAFASQRSGDEVLALFLSSPEVMAKFSNRTAWLTTIYRELLGARPAQADIDAWLGLIDCGVADAISVALEIVKADNVRTRLVQDWFRRYLSREASADQIHLALQQMQAGHSAETVLAGLFASHEYFLRAVNLALR